jgi:hypothetical protein
MARLCWGRIRARHAVPLLEEVRQNEIGVGAKHWRVAMLAYGGAG